MSDILQITAPITPREYQNTNRQNQSQNQPADTNQVFNLGDQTKIVRTNERAEDYAEQDLKDSSALNMPKSASGAGSPSGTIDTVKELLSSAAMAALRDKGDAALMNKISAFAEEVILKPENLMRDMVNQQENATIFSGKMWDALRTLVKTDSPDMQSAVMDFVRAAADNESKDELLGSLSANFKYLSQELAPSKAVSEELMKASEALSGPDAARNFRAIKSTLVQLVNYTSNSLLLDNKSQNLLPLVIHNISRYSENPASLRMSFDTVLEMFDSIDFTPEQLEALAKDLGLIPENNEADAREGLRTGNAPQEPHGGENVRGYPADGTADMRGYETVNENGDVPLRDENGNIIPRRTDSRMQAQNGGDAVSRSADGRSERYNDDEYNYNSTSEVRTDDISDNNGKNNAGDKNVRGENAGHTDEKGSVSDKNVRGNNGNDGDDNVKNADNAETRGADVSPEKTADDKGAASQGTENRSGRSDGRTAADDVPERNEDGTVKPPADNDNAGRTAGADARETADAAGGRPEGSYDKNVRADNVERSPDGKVYYDDESDLPDNGGAVRNVPRRDGAPVRDERGNDYYNDDYDENVRAEDGGRNQPQTGRNEEPQENAARRPDARQPMPRRHVSSADYSVGTRPQPYSAQQTRTANRGFFGNLFRTPEEEPQAPAVTKEQIHDELERVFDDFIIAGRLPQDVKKSSIINTATLREQAKLEDMTKLLSIGVASMARRLNTARLKDTLSGIDPQRGSAAVKLTLASVTPNTPAMADALESIVSNYDKTGDLQSLIDRLGTIINSVEDMDKKLPLAQVLNEALGNLAEHTDSNYKPPTSIDILSDFLLKNIDDPSMRSITAMNKTDMIQTMLTSPGVFNPLMHFFVPLDAYGMRAFAELWVDRNADKNSRDIADSDGETSHVFMCFDMEDVGYFELEMFAHDKNLSVMLLCPEGKEAAFEQLKTAVPRIAAGVGYTVGTTIVDTLYKKRSLNKIFPRLRSTGGEFHANA